MTRIPAAAAPARALPAHDEPPRAPSTACRWSSRCTTTTRTSRPPTRCPTSTPSATGCWSRRSRRRRTGRRCSARCGPGCRRAAGPTCSPALVYRGGTTITLHRDLETIPVLAPAGRDPAAGGRRRRAFGTANPDALELRVYAGRGRGVRPRRGPGRRAVGGDPVHVRRRRGADPPGRAAQRDAVPPERRYDVVLCGFAGVDRVPRWTVSAIDASPGPVPGSVSDPPAVRGRGRRRGAAAPRRPRAGREHRRPRARCSPCSTARRSRSPPRSRCTGC